MDFLFFIIKLIKIVVNMYSYFMKVCYYIERNYIKSYKFLNGGSKMAHKISKPYIIKIMSILFCIPFILILVVVNLSTIRNNIARNSFAEQLHNYKLPENTTLEEKYQLCGNLVGSRNDLDFLAAILIKTELSEASIKSYYFKANFRGARKISNGPIIEIYRPKGVVLNSHYLEHESIYFSTLENVESMEEYMVIVISDGGYKTWFDMRAN